MKIGELGESFQGFKDVNAPQKSEGTGFSDLFGNFVKDVNDQEQDSLKLAEGMAKGDDVELHQVMIASEKAKSSFDLLMEIRNKALDMYKELTKMQ